MFKGKAALFHLFVAKLRINLHSQYWPINKTLVQRVVTRNLYSLSAPDYVTSQLCSTKRRHFINSHYKTTWNWIKWLCLPYKEEEFDIWDLIKIFIAVPAYVNRRKYSYYFLQIVSILINMFPFSGINIYMLEKYNGVALFSMKGKL